MRFAALALLLASIGCRRAPAKIHSCADEVRGVWRVVGEAPPRRYHLYDLGRTVELYPMWDATVPPGGKKAVLAADPAAPVDDTPIYSPPRIALQRNGERLEGSSSFRLTRGGKTCVVDQPARLTGCTGGRAVFGLRQVIEVDRESCVTKLTEEWTDVPLVRE